MLTCPECNTHYPHGTLLCLNDGHRFTPEPVCHALDRARSIQFPLQHALELRIEHVDGVSFEGHVPMILISQACLNGPPIRLGRRDLKVSPPVYPEIDFHPFFTGASERPPISRLHAVIESVEGRPHLRSCSHVPTFVRRTGQSTATALRVQDYWLLQDQDIIYLASPEGRHIRLRVYIPTA